MILYKILSIKIPGMVKIPGTIKIPGMFQFYESMACNIYDIANTFNHGIQNHIQQKILKIRKILKNFLLNEKQKMQEKCYINEKIEKNLKKHIDKIVQWFIMIIETGSYDTVKFLN